MELVTIGAVALIASLSAWIANLRTELACEKITSKYYKESSDTYLDLCISIAKNKDTKEKK